MFITQLMGDYVMRVAVALVFSSITVPLIVERLTNMFYLAERYI